MFKEMKIRDIVFFFFVNMVLYWIYWGNVIKWFDDVRNMVRKYMD